MPTYTYVGGRSPHPRSDPAGHSYGQREEQPPPPDPDRWPESALYLYGFDLFNRGYYWEAHEVWEALWHAAGRQGKTADFLKGLIKLAAAGVKVLEGNPVGTTSHAARAAELWREVAGTPETGARCFGLILKDLIGLAEKVRREGWPEPAPILLPAVEGP